MPRKKVKSTSSSPTNLNVLKVFLVFSVIAIATLALLQRHFTSTSQNTTPNPALAATTYPDSYLGLDISDYFKAATPMALQRSAAKSLVDTLTSRIGLYKFNTIATHLLSLTDNSLDSSVKSTIDSISGVDDTSSKPDKVITAAKNKIIGLSPRPACPAIVVLTKGNASSTNQTYAKNAAKSAREAGIRVYAVGISPTSAQETFLKTLVNSTYGGGAYAKVTSATGLSTQLSPIINHMSSLCGVPPTPTPAPAAFSLVLSQPVYRDAEPQPSPGTIREGDRVAYTTIITNTGGQSATLSSINQRFTSPLISIPYRIYINGVQVTGTVASNVLTVNNPVTLAPNNTATFIAEFILNPGGAGSTLTGQSFSIHNSITTNSNSVTLTVEAAPTPGPADLTILNATPTLTATGLKVQSVAITVWNRGGTSVNQTLQFKASTKYQYPPSIWNFTCHRYQNFSVNLAVGGQQIYTFTGSPDPLTTCPEFLPGSGYDYYLDAIVDSSNLLIEENETNNMLTIFLTTPI